MDDLPASITELLDYLDSESDRFWTRFHIFTALQIAAVMGFAKLAEVLKAHGAEYARPIVFRLMLLFMTVCSFVGAIAITRGFDIQHALTQAINDAFEAHADEAISPNIYRAVADHAYFRGSAATITASLFAWTCAMIWPAVWFWFVHRGSTIDAMAAANDGQTDSRIPGRTRLAAAVLGVTVFLLMFRVPLVSSLAVVLTTSVMIAFVIAGFAAASLHLAGEIATMYRSCRGR